MPNPRTRNPLTSFLSRRGLVAKAVAGGTAVTLLAGCSSDDGARPEVRTLTTSSASSTDPASPNGNPEPSGLPKYSHDPEKNLPSEPTADSSPSAERSRSAESTSTPDGTLESSGQDATTADACTTVKRDVADEFSEKHGTPAVVYDLACRPEETDSFEVGNNELLDTRDGKLQISTYNMFKQDNAGEVKVQLTAPRGTFKLNGTTFAGMTDPEGDGVASVVFDFKNGWVDYTVAPWCVVNMAETDATTRNKYVGRCLDALPVHVTTTDDLMPTTGGELGENAAGFQQRGWGSVNGTKGDFVPTASDGRTARMLQVGITNRLPINPDKPSDPRTPIVAMSFTLMVGSDGRVAIEGVKSPYMKLTVTQQVSGQTHSIFTSKPTMRLCDELELLEKNDTHLINDEMTSPKFPRYFESSNFQHFKPSPEIVALMEENVDGKMSLTR